MAAIDTTLLPVESLLYEGSVVAIGRFACPPRHSLFRDSGPTRNHVVVFPRTSLAIRHHFGDFVSTPNNVVFHNAGDGYSRRAAEPGVGDIADWFAVAPGILEEIAGDGVSASRPFTRSHAHVSPALYASERRLVHAIESGCPEPLGVDEWALNVIGEAGVASRAESEHATQRVIDRVECAKSILAADLGARVNLRAVSSEAGMSLFRLCRMFKRVTGTTMHAYRLQLRLHRAADELLGRQDILSIALTLGFSSHSHFTHSFRAAFGVTPSQFRARCH